MMDIVYVWSDQDLTPRAGEVLRTIRDRSGLDFTWSFVFNPSPLVRKVLVFGNKVPEGEKWNQTEFIHTYSIPQLMAKPNAVTVVTASLKLYLGERHEPPFHSDTFVTDRGWDFDFARAGFDFTKPVVMDIETDGNLGKTHTADDVNIISLAVYQPGVPIHVFVDPDRDDPNKGTLPFDIEAIKGLRYQLSKFECVIYHNGKFDMRVMNRAFNLKLVNGFDTMLAHHVLNHAAGMHGLKELAQRYLGAPDWEGDIKKYTKNGGHYENIPASKLVEYNGWDVYWTYQLYELFYPQIEADEDYMKAFLFEMSAADFLLDVEKNGIPFDVEAAHRLAVTEEVTMLKSLKALEVLLGWDGFNPGSWQQVKKALSQLGYEVKSTAEGVIQKLLDDYGDKDHKLAMFGEYLMKYRKASKIKGTYAEGWMRTARKGRVHPSFLVHGTSTGRLSSKEPNAQNMPREKKIRKIVAVPQEGRT